MLRLLIHEHMLFVQHSLLSTKRRQGQSWPTGQLLQMAPGGAAWSMPQHTDNAGVEHNQDEQVKLASGTLGTPSQDYRPSYHTLAEPVGQPNQLVRAPHCFKL